MTDSPTVAARKYDLQKLFCRFFCYDSEYKRVARGSGVKIWSWWPQMNEVQVMRVLCFCLEKGTVLLAQAASSSQPVLVDKVSPCSFTFCLPVHLCKLESSWCAVSTPCKICMNTITATASTHCTGLVWWSTWQFRSPAGHWSMAWGMQAHFVFKYVGSVCAVRFHTKTKWRHKSNTLNWKTCQSSTRS